LRLSESKGCQWNISSLDHIAETKVFVIQCEIQYVSEWWTPVIHCLPDRTAGIFRDERYNRNVSTVTLVYWETFNVSSSFQNNQFDCYISFTAVNTSSDNLISPANIHLWTSPAITTDSVTVDTNCKYTLSGLNLTKSNKVYFVVVTT